MSQYDYENKKRYFVMEDKTGIIRAAQDNYKCAWKYTNVRCTIHHCTCKEIDKIQRKLLRKG